MQPKMQQNQLTPQEIDDLLVRSETGVFSTFGIDGYPYSIPISFVWYGGSIYLHGRMAGEKIDNLRANPRVCFETHENKGTIYDRESPVASAVNVEYNSVIIKGEAVIVEDAGKKREVLCALVKKYAPELSGKPIPPETMGRTCVIEIIPVHTTGKFYRPVR